MGYALTIKDWLLIGAAALLLAGIVSLYYLKSSQHSRKNEINRKIITDADDPGTAFSAEEEEPKKAAASPALIITVKRNSAAASNFSDDQAAEKSSKVPGYWSCRYCQTLTPDDSDVCVACGHRKR